MGGGGGRRERNSGYQRQRLLILGGPFGGIDICCSVMSSSTAAFGPKDHLSSVLTAASLLGDVRLGGGVGHDGTPAPL